jgi:DNA polymerase III sliding clamp (beta) subunit (PCNA family)
MQSDQVALEFTDPSKSISLLPVPDADYYHIVMPMQTG